MRKLILGAILLFSSYSFISCSRDQPISNDQPTSDVIEIEKSSLPTSYFNSNTYQWNLVNATYITQTNSTIYSITQTIDFNFFNSNKAKSKTIKIGSTTFINPQWDRFYTVIEINLVKKINQTQNIEIVETPTYNKSGYPMIEFYLRDDSNGDIHYYTLGTNNDIKTQ